MCNTLKTNAGEKKQDRLSGLCHRVENANDEPLDVAEVGYLLQTDSLKPPA
jgi:hypothetical protein